MARGNGLPHRDATLVLPGFLKPMVRIKPPKPASRPNSVGLIARLRLFRKDMFRSQPDRLYRAKMARVRTPFYASVTINEPDLVKTVLEDRPGDFPKSPIIAHTLEPLLGRSVFVTNGDLWAQQRRIIDPAFEAGRLRESFAPMRTATSDAVARLKSGETEIEFEMAHLAADIIFRTLFSIPITESRARAVFDAFRAYQRAQPLLSIADLIKAPRWLPRQRRGRDHATTIRDLLSELVQERFAQIKAGTAPDDLATKIMTTPDPMTGQTFSPDQMVDQVAIFFLAGHETSASALSWALYCLACDPEAQRDVAAEVTGLLGQKPPEFSQIAKLRFTRDVFREVLRLYPPVPMMVRETTRPEEFRDTKLAPGAMCIISPWHIQRHEYMWRSADVFDPWRWQDETTRRCARDAYLPFSKGARVCPGAGFAMLEGVLALAMLVRAFHFAPTDRVPVPVAHLTVRAEDGIWLTVSPRPDPA